jgi:peptidase C25-like protein
MKTNKDHFMRRIFTLLLLLCGLTGFAQQYNNEWIRFNQTYYKFQVGGAGVHRITKSVLDAAGIGNTPVEFFELWSNGKLVPFYPSVPTGVLPAGGYLEFWGEPNDGKADKALYRTPASQHTDKISLISDISSYFLSINTTQTGLRFQQLTNDPDASVLPIEPYFMYTAGNYFRDHINPGFAAVVGEYVFSSSYDKGEYWSSQNFGLYDPLSVAISGLHVYAAGPQSFLRYGASGNALNARTLQVSVNGTQVNDTLMDYFNDIHTTVPLPTGLIAGGTATVQFKDNTLVGTDRIVASYFEVIYPRQFDFDNAANFRFTLPARSSGYNLEITNFNAGSSAPVLYDLTNGRRYIGNTAVAGKVRFALAPTSVAADYVLTSQDAANITPVVALATKNFINYAVAANQGTYLIISHPSLYTGTSGNNPVNDYAAYRQSAVGGAHNTRIIDIDELVDQFAFGIKKHPLSVKNFLRYAKATFAAQPRHVFLIGHGMTYVEYRGHEFEPVADKLNIIPTFGYPASDNMLSAAGVMTPIPDIPIGRLSVVSGAEIETYLTKVKEYENIQLTAPNTLAGRLWMKNVVHVTGGSDSYLGTVLCNFMNVYKSIIIDTLFGGKVYSFCKTTTNPIDELGSEKIAELFKEGISILDYFGHSSSTTLEFNLDNPQAYDNKGKYPIFYVNGCNAGNFFTYYPQRLVVNETLSEKFVLAKDRGSIAFVASTHFGIVNYLNLYLNGLNKTIADESTNTMGETQQRSIASLMNAAGSTDFYARLHAEEITYHGDPSLKLNRSPAPDYIIEESLIRINPAFISVAETDFDVFIKVVNLGKAISDSVKLKVTRTLPDGSSELIYLTKIKGVSYADSLVLTIPIQALRDKGQNKIVVTVDPDNELAEVSEANNSATKEFYIFEDELRTIYPYNFAIVNNRTQKLYASTANAFSAKSEFVMEIDTTEFFNSSLKVSKTVTSVGGLVQFDPGIQYLDSVVYHWRVARNVATAGVFNWENSSFIFIPGQIDGYNQSNFYQNKKSTVDRISLDSASMQWKFGTRLNNVFTRNGVFPTAAANAADFTISVNGSSNIRSVCGISGIIFNVFDPVTLKPWFNAAAGNAGQYGSGVVCGVERQYNFQYNILDPNQRKAAVDFLDLVPEGYFVVVKNISGTDSWTNTYAADWQADTAVLGQNNSLYHRLITQGFTTIDSFSRPRAFLFIYKKNKQIDFTPKYIMSEGINDRITLSVDCYTPDTLGYITSPKFGPAKAWKEVLWRGEELETSNHDNPTVDVIGVAENNQETVLVTLDKATHQLDVSAIDPSVYPYLKLRMRNVDSMSLTPYQLKSWRVYYDPVPEGAIAPNLYLISKDTLEMGEKFKFGIAFKNVTKTPFDSLGIKVTILDKNNVLHNIPIPRLRPLPGDDSVQIYFELDTKDYTGVNTLFVGFNPDKEQREQLEFNNFVYKNFYVGIDNINPLLDVTFDGIHILNRDIVSARPHIIIKLKDNSKFNLLNDTALNTVQVRFPDGKLRIYHFDNDTLIFKPATSSTENTATIEFNPAFLAQINPEGDEYELIVSGKDKSGNKAGKTEFRVTFKVISKPMISNVLNYPNPFSTSTAFVFTLTGSEVPQNMKIQILTVTGKIVREITMNELGPIRIGRNITEFKWNGTDQYGQKLANGVYLYRVVTSLNGARMDKYKSEGDVTDKLFNNSYGKMYLMR